MQHEAARPKGNRALGDEPMSQPMGARSRGQIARNPSTDQKKVRRSNTIKRVADFNESGAAWVPGHVSCSSCGHTGHPVLGDGTGANCARCGSYSVSKTKTATVLPPTRAEFLNPGDDVSLPNGKTVKVQRVRPHETSGKHCYVDTDQGTTMVERGSPFQVVPRNNRQQSMPGYGTPDGNTNRLPDEKGGTNAAPSSKCPVCGTSGLTRSGDHYMCSRCGYKESFGGAGGNTFSDARSIVRTFSTINGNTQSAIARRAQQVLTQEAQS